MNTAELLVGPITKLTCDAGHLALEGVTVEDIVHVITRHGDIMGSLVSNQFQSPNESTFIINCEKGTIKWPVKVDRPSGIGKHSVQTFTGEFKWVTQTRIKEISESITTN